MSVPTTQPFPWKSLEVTPRAEVLALTELRRWIAQRVRLDACVLALTGLLGADVRVLVGRAARVGARAGGNGLVGLEGGVGVVLAPADDDALTTAALLEVEPALALAVVARILRRPPPGAVNLSAPPSEAIAGAVAAVIVAAARRAHKERAPLRAVSAGAASLLEADFVRAGSGALAVALTVLVGDEAYVARLVFRRSDALSALPPEWTARSLSSLGELPLSLPIVACATPARGADVAALRAGDAWLPGTWPLEVARDADGGGANGATATGATLRGPVILAAPDAVTGVRARLVDGGRLVLSGEVDAVGLALAEADMTESEGDGALVDAVGDVPVVVRVEIGEARMAAREWAALGRGDVITLGRRVGELVLLRVGGVPIARGELVSVDGEVGVRIAERIAGGPTSA